MLEFWLDPQSSYYNANKIEEIKKMVLFCAAGFRSALATKSLLDMVLKMLQMLKVVLKHLKTQV